MPASTKKIDVLNQNTPFRYPFCTGKNKQSVRWVVGTHPLNDMSPHPVIALSNYLLPDCKSN